MKNLNIEKEVECVMVNMFGSKESINKIMRDPILHALYMTLKQTTIRNMELEQELIEFKNKKMN